MNMRMDKIDAPSLLSKDSANSPKRAPAVIFCAGVFLLLSSGCVMSKAQGDRLTHQVREVEDEIAKLQRVRHDMEILLVGQVRDLVDRIARLENQLSNLRQTLSEGSSRNMEMRAEIEELREALDQSQNRYRNLEIDQQSLLKNQAALKEAQNKIRIPPLKEDHFALAKKYYLGGKFDEAVSLFEHYIKEYPDDKDSGEAHYLLGEIWGKLATDKSPEESDRLNKKAVIAYQKVIEMYKGKNSVLREESLYKIGLVLKAINNKEGAKAAFKALVTDHGGGKRVKEAKKQLAELSDNEE